MGSSLSRFSLDLTAVLGTLPAELGDERLRIYEGRMRENICSPGRERWALYHIASDIGVFLRGAKPDILWQWAI